MTVAQALYNPFDPQLNANPYPAYRHLRDHDPVHRHEDPSFWVLSRFGDIWDAVREPGVFSSEQGLTFYPDEISTLGLAPTIVMLDPPRHGALRRLISRGLTPGRVSALEPMIREFVRERIGVLREKGAAADVHLDFASPIPTFVLAHLLGVPASDRARFDPWVAALTHVQNSGFSLESVGASNAVAEMFGYFNDLILARRANPAEDLISALTLAEVDGERLTDWDILGFCFVMVAGGNDTTGSLISHGVMLLDAFPDQRRHVVDDPGLISDALLEFLRLEGSVQGLARTTLAPVTINGVQIPAGEKVMMLYGSANRDDREFGPDADQLNITREIPRHLAFSSGPHFCVGSHLARLQARVALEELYAAHPEIGVDLSRAQRLQSPFTRGWTRLPAIGIT